MLKAPVAVVFIHGLARKPAPTTLEELWLWGLSRADPHPDAFPSPNPGLDLEAGGVPAFFTYYADVFYGDDHETDFEDMLEIASWLPQAVQEALMKKAAMEAYYYLFDKEFTRADGAIFMPQRELRSRFLASLEAALVSADKVVVVAHSMGTMVAYDVLRNVPACPQVETLITIGSPLGITEVQTPLAAGNSELDFPAAKLGRWINIYDPRDPIAADPVLANDFSPVDGKCVQDVEESNWGSWRHTVTHYLAGPKLRQALAAATGISL